MGTRVLSFVTAALFLFSLMAGAQTTANCTFTYFTPPSPYTASFEAFGINHWNTVVGQASTTTLTKGFIHTSGGTKIFGVPNAIYTSLNKRNYSGTSVGAYQMTNNSAAVGLVLAPSGSWTPLRYPGAYQTRLFGINRSNVIVGAYTTSFGGNQHGFKYSGGHFTKINFPNSVQTIPTAINDNGVIVGQYVNGNLENPPHGFKLSGSTYTSFDVAGEPSTQPQDISNGGTIVVGPNLLYKNGATRQVNVPNANETFVNGINDLNKITGVANYQTGPSTFTWKAWVGTCQ